MELWRNFQRLKKKYEKVKEENNFLKLKYELLMEVVRPSVTINRLKSIYLRNRNNFGRYIEFDIDEYSLYILSMVSVYLVGTWLVVVYIFPLVFYRHCVITDFPPQCTEKANELEEKKRQHLKR